MDGRINLELILEGEKQNKVLSVHSHVNKYLESVIYSKKIQEAACPLDYHENESINSEKNMFMLDKSFSLKENLNLLEASKDKFYKVEHKTITAPFRDIFVTNILGTKRDGSKAPLFYKHELPKNVIEVDIELSTNMESGEEFFYKISKEEESLYCNSGNYFDPNTGKYILYFVITTDSEGNSIKKLLSLTDVVEESTWEDVDLSTGKIKKELTRYTKEANNSGYTFRMTKEGPWYWAPKGDSSVSMMKPEGISYKSNWNIRINNGDIKAFSNGKLVRYWIPEFNQQPFSPYAPYNFALKRFMYFVNSKTLSFTHEDAAVHPEKKLHLEILCYDENEKLIEIYSTDQEKKGTEFRTTGINYRTDRIESWDNKSGVVTFYENIESSYTYYANYFTELKAYEMKEISFNPLQNKEIKDYVWVVYCIPNLDYHEKAIHYLGVDKEGIIRFTSQGRSNGYSNFKLMNDDGSFNSETIIGKKYKSITQEESFTKDYSSLNQNDYQYLILGEIYILEKERADKSFLADVRERKRMIKKESIKDVIVRNPRVLQSKHGYGEDGLEYGRNNSLIYQVPIQILEKFGGELTEKKVEKILKKTSPSTKKIIVDYVYKKVRASVDNTERGKIKFKLKWEGPDLIYNIYRKVKKEKEFELIQTINNPGSDFVFTDENIKRKRYFYAFSITEDGIEYPKSNTFTVVGEEL